jgi:hypothetical protein
MPDQLSIGCGCLNRSELSGGCANGIPKYASTGRGRYGTWYRMPRTRPDSVTIIRSSFVVNVADDASSWTIGISADGSVSMSSKDRTRTCSNDRDETAACIVMRKMPLRQHWSNCMAKVITRLQSNQENTRIHLISNSKVEPEKPQSGLLTIIFQHFEQNGIWYKELSIMLLVNALRQATALQELLAVVSVTVFTKFQICLCTSPFFDTLSLTNVNASVVHIGRV